MTPEQRKTLESYLCDGSKTDRCDRCSWPLAEGAAEGCVVGDCSMRGEGNHYRPQREQRFRVALRALLAENEELKARVGVLENSHGTHFHECACAGCHVMVPGCWETPMCRPCATEDCEHGS